MVNYREILRLHSLGYNITEIAGAIHSSRNTIRETLNRAKAKQIVWPLPPEETNPMLFDKLYPEHAERAQVYMKPDCTWIHKELARNGVNLSLLWREYQAECQNSGRIPYQYTQFCELYRNWARKSKATMRIHHKPGDAMQVDWAGDTLPIKNPVTGTDTDAYLFIAVLPCSCYTYAELCDNERSENWLLCHVHAYEYFGGIPRLLIPDNLKTGVTKNTRYETRLNRSYAELAEHYHNAIVPARVEAPKDKSLAEGTVRYASTWILAALRNRTFFSLEEAKEAVAEKLEELNGYPFQKRAGNRREAYLSEEKEFMQPLPDNPFEPAVWSTAKVQLDYTVSDGLNKYSVPFDLIGETVDVRVSHNAVEIFFHGNRIASHVRDHVRRKDPIIVPTHMPENHRKYLSYTKEDFLAWAADTGVQTQKVVRYFLESGRAPEQGFKYCASLARLQEKYGTARIEEACDRILRFDGSPSIRGISLLLKHPPTPAEPARRSAVRSSRGITRGADQFRKGGEDHD